MPRAIKRAINLAPLIVLLLLTAAYASPPNVIVIMADDLGYGELECYGAEDVKTPHLDELAREGMRFENFYANCCVCSPTRAALLTGRYPELVGVPGVIRTHAQDNWGYLRPHAVTLADVLGDAGYHTALVGKWHLGLESPNLPNERGFAEVQGFLGDMMDDYFHHRRHDINYLRHNQETIEPQGHATDLFTIWACDYLRGRRDTAQPFFLYLAYNAPHTPIQPTDASLKRVRARAPDIPEERAALVAMIEHLDEGVGRVLATLDEIDQADHTLIIFTSDNGGQLSVGADNGAWRDGKQSMYEGGLRVPAIVRWPGRVAPQSATTTVAVTMDLFPTICAAAQAEARMPPQIDGRSLLPALSGQPQDDAPRTLFFERREGGPQYAGLTIHAVRDGPWKLVKNSPFTACELYNLNDDPAEQHDRARDNPAELGRLTGLLQRHLQRAGSVPWQAPQ